MRIVLASSSPRRHELLAALGVTFDVIAADLDEAPLPGERPTEYVRRLASAKAVAVARSIPDALVVGADTTVDLDGRILAKPVDAADATVMLRDLSARTHRVHTGVAVCTPTASTTTVTTTFVTVAALTPASIEWYVGTGEPLDKAGAYAIQGAGAAFVTRVVGSVSNVVGLPLTVVADLLAAHGVLVGNRR
jgi:septum formation protein